MKYEPVQPSLFHISDDMENVLTLKINPELGVQDALRKLEAVFKNYNPSSPFQASFVEEEFARKFGNEKRVSMAAFFAILTVMISCLGLFGLASFVAEQRTKEIGIRKMLGASVSNLWGMPSKDLAIPVVLSLCDIDAICLGSNA
jgi:putative ABC transport system permease protein